MFARGAAFKKMDYVASRKPVDERASKQKQKHKRIQAHEKLNIMQVFFKKD